MKLKPRQIKKRNLVDVGLLILILIIGMFFRFTGINWDESYHLHPDERFLTMVESSISPVKSLAEYFNTSHSTLNPHNVLDSKGNRVYPFFVYGTLPLFIVRYAGEWLNQTGYSQIHIVGRYLSGISDLGTIILVFLITKKLFNRRTTSLIAAFFYSLSVLPIQISHFFIVDNFTTFFSMLAFYAAVRIYKKDISKFQNYPKNKIQKCINNFFSDYGDCILFSFALGMAAASKINSAMLALLLPMAMVLKDAQFIFKEKSIQKYRLRFSQLLFSGILSLIVFRIFQPYAFSGPGFLNFSLNPVWIRNLQELKYLSSGSSNYPPSLQWARRSIVFPLENLIFWGMGIPLGLSAILSMIFMGWKIIEGKWKKYFILWIWNLVYLVWQIFRWNPTMRYLLLVYPTLSISASWFVQLLVTRTKKKVGSRVFKRLILGIIMIFVIIGTFIWALSFFNIYRQPMTRIHASEWIYKNIPGAINLKIEDEEEFSIQPIPYSHHFTLEKDTSLIIQFIPDIDGIITKFYLNHILSLDNNDSLNNLILQMVEKEKNTIIFESTLSQASVINEYSQGKDYVLEISPGIQVNKGDQFLIKIDNTLTDANVRMSGVITARIDSEDISIDQIVFEPTRLLKGGLKNDFIFTPRSDGKLSGIELFRLLPFNPEQIPQHRIEIEIVDNQIGESVGKSSIRFSTKNDKDYRGKEISINFENTIDLKSSHNYTLSLRLVDKNDAVFLYGSKIAKESDWDDALPLSMFGQNPFDPIDGIYHSDLNFQMYWDDNEEKLSRFIDILKRADYIVITSNRQWGSTTQIPERYPLTQLFYRLLMGCSHDDVQYCYKVAKPGTFSGKLGFSLEKTFQTNLKFLTLEFNSQFAEEAFTVYDHPKVLIFKKNASFDLSEVIEKLKQANLEEVINLSPEEADKRPGKLNLPKTWFDNQKTYGTWGDLFSYDSIQNKYPILAIIIWYFAISVMGWIVYPVVRIGFYGLWDKGYLLLKPLGLIVLALPVWWLGSIDIPVTRALILKILLLIFLVNAVVLFRNKSKIISEIRLQFHHFMRFELIALVFFLVFLFVRLGNPDLWHPYKGGEKPMDFSYFNAIIKSVHFPPYNPWYSGGYINYYYYGFVLAALPVKALGIIPSIAYNLILPSFFSFTALASFSIGWNFYFNRYTKTKKYHLKNKKFLRLNPRYAYLLGFIAAFFILIIGNLGTVRMMFQGFQRIGISSLSLENNRLFTGFASLIQGIKLYLNGVSFDYSPGDWYWIPSRSIPGEPITEFPYFTFLYGDPHAHLFAYPITIISLVWILSILVNQRKKWKLLEYTIEFILGATVIGALRPSNTWDFPTFLSLASISIFYMCFTKKKIQHKILPYFPGVSRKIIIGITASIIFMALVFLLYAPFSKWYGLNYSSIKLWGGDRTPINAFITHWGFFLFIIYIWLLWQIWKWLATTPLMALKPLFPYRNIFLGIAVLILVGVALVILWGVPIIILIMPATLFAFLLMIRKSGLLIERFILLILLSGFFLTFLVETFVIQGDIGRMNTVFKFYLQAWTFFAISSAYFIYDMFANAWNYMTKGLKNILLISIIMFTFAVMLFPVTASIDKITDRISSLTPVTLDGMTFMKYSTYIENEYVMDLNQDYQAIKWMQENVVGTPVIIEANVPEYRWGNRFSIYTGLPVVIGWNWHQRQQRAINPGEWVINRIEDVQIFYSSDDPVTAKSIIEKYSVDYFIVGQLERAIYPETGLNKFRDRGSDLWCPVYQSDETTIFKVILN